MNFNLIFHYMGRFLRDCLISYTGGHEHEIEIDLDKWSLFEAIGIVKEITELEHSEFWSWWYNNDDDRYNITVSDTNAEKVYQYTMEMKSTLHIYVEHKGNVQEVEVCDVQEDEIGDVREDDVGDAQEDEVGDVHINDGGDVQEDENEDNGSSEDNDFEVDGLSFDDSEDEIAIELDDCFEDHGKTSDVKVTAKNHKRTKKRVQIVIDNARSSKGVDHEMDINYASEELGSSDHDASDKEKDPKYPRFKMKDLDKNYKFRVGLEFVTLEEFKEAIIEWLLLNGREREREREREIVRKK
ncbi:unnamed protein product [Lathyrus oleraceus]